MREHRMESVAHTIKIESSWFNPYFISLLKFVTESRYLKKAPSMTWDRLVRNHMPKRVKQHVSTCTRRVCVRLYACMYLLPNDVFIDSLLTHCRLHSISDTVYSSSVTSEKRWTALIIAACTIHKEGHTTIVSDLCLFWKERKRERSWKRIFFVSILPELG
jgi:hypothetical protein